jgi:hypothetical protein
LALSRLGQFFSFCFFRANDLDSAARQGSILVPMRLLGLGAQASLAIGLVLGIVAVEPNRFAFAFEGEDMGRDAIEKPAIMGDHHGQPAKFSNASSSACIMVLAYC